MYATIIMFENSPSRGPWENWSILTVIVALLGAAGGILVAATLKYADAILKTLATAGSIVISTLLGHFFLNGPLNVIIVIGAIAVILAIFNYTMDSSIPQTTVGVKIASPVSALSEARDSDVESAPLLTEKELKDHGSAHHDKSPSTTSFLLKTRKGSSKDESE